MKLTQILERSTTEEEIKSIFAKQFKLKLNTKHNIDLYTPQVTFEFKSEVNLQNITARARTVAQALYYVRRLKYGSYAEVPSRYICVADKYNAIILETKDFANYYLKTKGKKYDWDLPASSPCKTLVKDLSKDETIKKCHVYQFSTEEKQFVEQINRCLTMQMQLFDFKKEINEENFYDIFKYWQTLFGKYVENGRKSSEYFITDIERGKSTLLENGVIFRMSGGTIIEKQIPANEYKYFWNVYEKVDDVRTMITIRQKMDRISEIDMRRFTGEFFTPIEFAKKAVEYIERTVGANWYKSGKFRLWDMSAGTGNLEFVLPLDALQYCYVSTLLEDDAKYCKKIYPTATVFQYDYLNDDVEFLAQPTLFELGAKYKKPQKLIDDLKNPDLKWIIFINPPYATANNPERKNKISKDTVSMTEIRKLMTNINLGEVSRELYSQFLYRINLEFKDHQTYIGMFSTLKYMISTNDQKMRDDFFNYKFERGFMFSSQNFQGCKGKFPVGFIIWNNNKHIKLDEQNISLDIYDLQVDKIAIKKIKSVKCEQFLSKWIKRPRCIKKFPPLSGALNIAAQNKDRRDRIAENFLGSLMSKGNDFVNQNFNAIFSAPYVSAGAMSIIEENFEQCMIVHMVRRLPKANWLNDRDQFMQPTKELTREFINDSIVWSLFSNSNNTAAISNVEYEGNNYQIKNNFYPFKVSEVNEWQCNNIDIKQKIYLASVHNDNRFVAKWLAAQTLSAEAAKVISAARIIYKRFYKVMNQLDCIKYKIDTYDVGWYQIRNSMKDAGFSTEEIQQPMKELGEKIMPQIYEFGFLSDDVKYFE